MTNPTQERRRLRIAAKLETEMAERLLANANERADRYYYPLIVHGRILRMVGLRKPEERK